MRTNIKSITLKLIIISSILVIALPLYARHKSVTKITFGKVEEVLVFAEMIKFEAKLDTGAKTSSLSADNIQEFRRHGERWVSFQITDLQNKKTVVQEFRLVRYARIKQHQKPHTAPKYVIRPVIKILICLGEQKKFIEVNLANRSNFNYPILLGRDAIIKFHGIVDPSKTFVTVPTCGIVQEHYEK